jgi:hypothetical protein
MTAYFPYVECELHGKQRSYAVCLHVSEEGAEPARVVPATLTDMGVITCALPKHNIYGMKTFCEVCRQELFTGVR